jgi:Regulator of ribonuclease activity B/Family of unknown function (DUF695)
MEMSRFTRILGGRYGRRARWEPVWQAYPGTIAEAPASWFVDLGAVDAAPVPGLPVRLDLSVAYPGGGLPGEDDLARLGELDGRVRAIAVEHAGVFVGRVATGGVCRYTAHLPTAPDQPIRLSSPGGGALEIATEYDPHWAYVRDHLAPDERQAQLMADLVVITVLQEHGDELAHTREVQHVALFAGPEPAQDAAATLQADGFTVAVERDDEGEFRLTATRRDAVVPPGVHDLSWTVKELVERHGGSYDGWSCVVTTS